jgi:HAD superfamily hydrolase (TIGR01509 family)
MMRNDIAVVFDMDGTLTRPLLDFEKIRKEIGVGPQPILEQLDTMTPAERVRAMEILDRHEAEAAEKSELYDGTCEALAALRDAHVLLGLMTRNSRESVRTVLRKHNLVFDAVRSREDGAIKPAPDGLLSLLAEFGVPPANAWMVGDFKFDLECGRAAGAKAVLMVGDGPMPEYAHLADHVIRSLQTLVPLVLNLGSLEKAGK